MAQSTPASPAFKPLDPRKFQDAAQISAALLLQRMSDTTAADR